MINLRVPEELNKKRKALNLTWRQVIEAGLETNPKDLAKIKLRIKTAAKAMKEAYEELKQFQDFIK